MNFHILVILSVTALVRARQEVCCDTSGDCFNDDPPFDNANYPLPQCFEPQYILYRSNLDEPVEITRGNTPPEYDGSQPTLYMLHGWRDWLPGWYENATSEFFASETYQDYNVIFVEWRDASYENLTQSTSNTRVLGSELADMNAQLSPPYSWCIGHSLGAHSCGQAGKRNASFDRITALDPTGTNFDTPQCNEMPEICRLHPSDAPFVDAIHTDAEGTLGAGTYNILGDQDFFPNGGVGIQPGCDGAPTAELCSHNYAVDMFIASINNECFQAESNCTDSTSLPASCSACDGDCPNMGASATDSTTGIFYLETVEDFPYCGN